MAVELVLPRLGREMESGLVAEWYVPDGAPVGRGELVYRLETDYVACDIEAEVEGVVRHGLQAGEDAAPGAAVGTIVEPSDRARARQEQAERVHELPALRVRRDLEPGSIRRGAPGLQMARDAAPAWGSLFDDPGVVAPEPEPTQLEVEPEVAEPIRLRPVPLATPDNADDWVPAEDATEAPGEEGADHAEEEAERRAPMPLPVVQAVAPQVESLDMRTTVSLTEAVKMCEQLGREWQSHGIAPRVEDVIARAVARALDAELLGTDTDGRRLRLISHSAAGERSADLKEPGTRVFREVVTERQAHGAATGVRNWPVLATYAGTGIDDARPRLEDGDLAGITAGDSRETAAGPVATITLGYAGSMVSDSQAASFLARVHELIEAPYALLAE